MYKNVLFDLDGTLTDPFEGITNCIVYALSRLGIEVQDRRTLTPFIGPPLETSFKKYFNLSDSDAQAAVEYYRQLYPVKDIFELTVYDGVIDMLKRLNAGGVKCYLATSKPEPLAERITQKFGFDGLLSGVAGASYDHSRDEKPDVIRYALKRFDIADAVMVGDRKYDVEGAKLNGMKCIGVTYGYGGIEELKTAGADFIVHSPSQVADIVLS